MSSDAIPRPVALLFDLDGTLVDSYAPIAESLNAVRGAFGLPAYSLDEVRLRVGHGLESLIEESIGAARIAEGVRIFRDRYREVFRSGTRPLAGVASTLPVLAREGFRMAIVSNKPSFFTREILSSLAMAGHFESVWGPERVARPKPDPAMVRGALQELGATPDEAIYIGDMSVDILTARASGVRIWVLPTGSESRESLLASGPDALLERFEEIPSRLIPGCGSGD